MSKMHADELTIERSRFTCCGLGVQASFSLCFVVTWRVIPIALGIIMIGLILPNWAGESEDEASRRASLNGFYALTIYHAKRAAEYENEGPDLFYSGL